MDIVNESFLFERKSIGKLLAIVFAILMCSILIFNLNDDSTAVGEDFTIDGIGYIITSEGNTKTVEIYRCGETLEDLKIPSKITVNSITYSVTSIGNFSFANCYELKSVTIPNSVKSIGNYAFKGCYGLTSIEIPNGVDTINQGTFSYCSGMKSVTIPNSVTSIGTHAFLACYSLTSVYIPNSVKMIGNQAFLSCNGLTSVTIPKNIWVIGPLAFYDCRFYSSNGNALWPDADELSGHTYSGSNSMNLVQDVNPFTISFKSEGKTILSYKLGPGAPIIPPNNVTKESDVQYDYTFTKWDGYIKNMKASGNTTLNAKFTEVLRSYTITFMNEDVEVDSKILKYGKKIVLPKYNPVKDSDAQYDYTFGWIGYTDGMTVAGDATYNSVFKETFRIYSEAPSVEVLNNIINQTDNPVLQINVNAINTIENSVFQSLGNKPLAINVMDGNDMKYSWTFKGNYKPEAGTFNAGINNTIDEDINEDLNNSISSTDIDNPLVLNFAASGELPVNASVRYDVSEKYTNGTKLSLFFYNEETKQLEDQSQTLTVNNGFITFNLTHCSYYVLSQDAADNTLLYVGIVIVIVVIISLIVVVLVRSRRKA